MSSVTLEGERLTNVFLVILAWAWRLQILQTESLCYKLGAGIQKMQFFSMQERSDQ